MNRLLGHCTISNIKKIRCYFFYRFKSDIKSESFDEQLLNSGNIKRDISKHLLCKILKSKDQKTKQKLMKALANIKSYNNSSSSPTNSLLRTNIKKNEVTINKNMKMNCCTISQNQTDNKLGKSSENLSRPIRREASGEVIWGFIPKEWVTFFVPVTGQSGFYTLLVTLGTYLLSKEIYVCDHEYYNGISLVILCVYIVKKQGPLVAKYLDKEIDKYERALNLFKEKKIQDIKKSIVSEHESQECMEGQIILIQAKRENVHLQREAEFRQRQMEVYENVTRILNYHVELEEVKKRIQHKNLIQWVTKEVEKSLTPELKEKFMNLCMADIKEIFDRNEKK